MSRRTELAPPTPTTPNRQVIRCAIYTRKSTEEGLDQEFNSLDAQREAGESYIGSQRHEGWTLLPDRYDDGGFSGGSMDRPALKRLMRDVESGRIDVVVVYKVDRLSRSLLDFALIIEALDRNSASFVSVTQSFCTTTSMGRLTLNILLSFAQFEREIITERIRDKVAAAKRRGKYCGGAPILGYDVDRAAKRLVVNTKEAYLVQLIFRRFALIQSTTNLAKELNSQGHRTKSWSTTKGKLREGQHWHQAYIYRVLNNRLYIGEVVHRDQIYPGEQEAIVTQAMWDRAHAILEQNHRVRANTTRAETVALLKGVIRCGHCGCAMGPTYGRKNGKQYHYYLCVKASKEGVDSCPVRRVAAGEIEKAVLEQLGAVFRSPTLVAKTFFAAREQEEEERRRLEEQSGQLNQRIAAARAEALKLAGKQGQTPEGNSARMRVLSEEVSIFGRQLAEAEKLLSANGGAPVTEQGVMQTFQTLENFWDDLFPAEKNRLIHLLVESATVREDGLDLILRTHGLSSLVTELTAYAEEAEGRATA